jgi:hypothetical protein
MIRILFLTPHKSDSEIFGIKEREQRDILKFSRDKERVKGTKREREKENRA